MNRARAELLGTPRRTRTMPFLNRLRSLVTLTSQEEQFIESLQSTHSFPLGAQVYNEGDPVIRPWIVAAGWACRLRTLLDGRRQIISLFLPGDTIGVRE